MAVLLSRQLTQAERIHCIEYLETTGTQWFNTGFKPNNSTRIVLDGQFTGNMDVSQYRAPFGARGGGRYFELYKASGNNWSLTFLWNTTYTQYFTIDYTARHTFEINRNTAAVDQASLTYPAAAFQLDYPLYLCADDNGGKADAVTPLRIWSCQIYDNGVLVRDYWPCYDPEGVVCLYDRVSKAYAYNAGTGSCMAGGIKT